MSGLGEDLKGNNSNVVDMKEYIDSHKEELKEANKFIEDMKKDIEGHPFSNADNSSNVEDNPEVESVKMSVLVDPATGEHKIIGRAGEESKYNFEGMIKQINDGDPDILTSKPFSEQEIIKYLKTADDDTLIHELAGDGEVDISAKALRDLLDIVNRKLNGEKFNIYKESPDEFKKLVDSYISEGIGVMHIGNAKMLASARNRISENLIAEFIHNIKMDRAKTDFAKELENIYNNSAVLTEQGSLNYIEERNAAYREAANSIEDEGKRERLNAILDRIEEARNLTELKEFAKRCKIKKYDLERPDKRVYSSFLSKYKDSVNNIYDIQLARTVLVRHFEPYGLTPVDIDMLLIAFCRQCNDYSVDNVLEHAYMYYFLYYCVMLDGDKSETFKKNILEVIENLYERNR